MNPIQNIARIFAFNLVAKVKFNNSLFQLIAFLRHVVETSYDLKFLVVYTEIVDCGEK